MNPARILIAAAPALAWANAAGHQAANPLTSGAPTCATTPMQLPTGVLVSADAANTGKIFVGGPSYPLATGAGGSLDMTSQSMVWFGCQNTTDTLHFIGH